MSDCIFCKIINKQLSSDVVFENDELLVIKDIHPKAPVHLLLIPKQHIDSLNELNQLTPELITKLMLTVPEIAKQQNLSGYRTIINTGASGGQIIFHLHVHILSGG